MAAAAQPRLIELDFSRYGRSDVVLTRLFSEERQGLEVGDLVLLEGDTIEPELFEVAAISDDAQSFTFRRAARGA